MGKTTAKEKIKEEGKDEIENILQEQKKLIYSKEEADPAVLYIVDKNTRDKLLLAQPKLDNAIINYYEYRSISEERLKRHISQFGFNGVCNFLNPLTPAYHYNVYYEKKYKHIVDREKIKDKLEEEFLVWKNAYLKETSLKLSEIEDASQEYIDQQKALIQQKIDEAYKELLYLKENFEDIQDIRILSIQRSPDYPTCLFSIKNNSKTVMVRKHLSIKKINVLWFEPVHKISAKAFISQAKNAFGDVFYIN